MEVYCSTLLKTKIKKFSKSTSNGLLKESMQPFRGSHKCKQSTLYDYSWITHIRENIETTTILSSFDWVSQIWVTQESDSQTSALKLIAVEWNGFFEQGPTYEALIN